MHSRPQSLADVASRVVAQVVREHGPGATEEQVMVALPHYVSDFRHELLLEGVTQSCYEMAPVYFGGPSVREEIVDETPVELSRRNLYVGDTFTLDRGR